MFRDPHNLMPNAVLLAVFVIWGFVDAFPQTHRLSLVVTDPLDMPVGNASLLLNGDIISANDEGRISLALPAGKYQAALIAAGFVDTLLSIAVHTDLDLHIALRSNGRSLQPVVVMGSSAVQKNQTGMHILGMAEIRKLPVLFGEVDPMKIITLLPGVKGGGDASAGIYVRGGGPDQNLVLLDGIPLYNPNHLLGFFSVFNGDAIKDIELFKGGMPAEYGGRLSSVISVNSREGNRDSLKLSGGIGLISSRLSVEGPVIRKKAAFIISVRRTYIDELAKLIAPDSIRRNGYYFLDLNAGMDIQLNTRNLLYLTFYAGRDKFKFVDPDDDGSPRQFTANWGNTIAGIKWKYQPGKKWHQELTAVRNSFNLDSRIAYGVNGIVLASGLTDHQLKNDWNFTPRPWLNLKAGLQYIWHSFRPGAGETTQGLQEFKSRISEQYAREAAAYLSADIDMNKWFHLMAGLRYSYFNLTGPSERVIYSADGSPSGKVETYKKGESIAMYHYPEPRVSLLFTFNHSSRLKISYTRTIQYLHLATTSAATFPSDLWVPSGRLIKPGIGDQLAAGYFRSFRNGGYAFSIETYYKTLTNQIEFKPGAQLLLNQNLEGEMIFGEGKAYGIELFLQKRTGRFTGWIGYTLSRSERTFPRLNRGRPFPFRYDRTHDISFTANYQFNTQWQASAVFVYGTGNALTLPTGRFAYSVGYDLSNHRPEFSNINQYEAINDYRMPAYHRLDLAFTYTPKPNTVRRYKSSWVFGLFNVYNRQNPYFIYMDVDEEKRTIKGKKVFLFPLIPGITWNFKF